MASIYEKNGTNMNEMVQQAIKLLTARTVENQGKVKGDQRLAVRSSSTLEDLDKMAGAGLFDSILNVPLSQPAAVAKALMRVW
jgi:phosphoglucan,water dikinase